MKQENKPQRESGKSKLIRFLKEELEDTPLNSLLGIPTGFLLGLGLGATGKHTGHWEIPCILPAINFVTVGFPTNTGDLAYILGVATNYFPEIIQMYS